MKFNEGVFRFEVINDDTAGAEADETAAAYTSMLKALRRVKGVSKIDGPRTLGAGVYADLEIEVDSRDVRSQREVVQLFAQHWHMDESPSDDTVAELMDQFFEAREPQARGRRVNENSFDSGISNKDRMQGKDTETGGPTHPDTPLKGAKKPTRVDDHTDADIDVQEGLEPAAIRLARALVIAHESKRAHQVVSGRVDEEQTWYDDGDADANFDKSSRKVMSYSCGFADKGARVSKGVAKIAQKHGAMPKVKTSKHHSNRIAYEVIVSCKNGNIAVAVAADVRREFEDEITGPPPFGYLVESHGEAGVETRMDGTPDGEQWVKPVEHPTTGAKNDTEDMEGNGHDMAEMFKEHYKTGGSMASRLLGD